MVVIIYPKEINPALDTPGTNCFHNQNNANLWVLAGSFYNENTIVRKCKIPNFVFLKLLLSGNHEIQFGDELLISDDKVKDQLTTDSVFLLYWNKIKDSQCFKLDIIYNVFID